MPITRSELFCCSEWPSPFIPFAITDFHFAPSNPYVSQFPDPTKFWTETLLTWAPLTWASQVTLVVKNLPANVRDMGLITGLGRSLEEGMATHSSIFVWRIPMDRGAWWATVHRVAKNRTQLKGLSTHTLLHTHWIFGCSYLSLCLLPCFSFINSRHIHSLYAYSIAEKTIMDKILVLAQETQGLVAPHSPVNTFISLLLKTSSRIYPGSRWFCLFSGTWPHPS